MKPLTNKQKAVARVATLVEAERVLSQAGWGVIGQNWTAGVIAQILVQLNLVDIKEAPLVKALSIIIRAMDEGKAVAAITKAVMVELTGSLDQLKEQKEKTNKKIEAMEQLASDVANSAGHLQSKMVDL